MSVIDLVAHLFIDEYLLGEESVPGEDGPEVLIGGDNLDEQVEDHLLLQITQSQRDQRSIYRVFHGYCLF